MKAFAPHCVWRLVVVTFIMLASCHRVSNHVDPQILSCGEFPTEHSDLQLTPVFGPSQERFTSGDLEAFAVNAEQDPFTLPISSKGCVAFEPSAHLHDTLVVRTRDGRRFAWAGPFPGNNAASHIDLADISNARPVLDCTVPAFVSDQNTALYSLVKGPYDRLLLRFELDPTTGQTVNVGPRDNPDLLQLISTWPSGEHKVRMRLMNLMDGGTPPDFQSCTLMVDRRAPEVFWDDTMPMMVHDKQEYVKMSPGQSIKLGARDDNTGSRIYYCLKEIHQGDVSASCAPEEYQPYNGPAAPEKGLWQLSSYAVDGAGRRSPVINQQLLIYHQGDVEALKGLINQIRLELTGGEFLDGVSHLLRAEMKRQSLSPWENKDFYYPIFEHFLRSLDPRNPLFAFPLQGPAPYVAFSYSEDGAFFAILSEKTRAFQIYSKKGEHVRDLPFAPNTDSTQVGTMGFSIKHNVVWFNTPLGPAGTSVAAVDGSYNCTIPASTLLNEESPEVVFVENTRPYDATSRRLRLFNRHCELVKEIELPASAEAGGFSTSGKLRAEVTLDSSSQQRSYVVIADDPSHPLQTGTFKLDTKARAPLFSRDDKWIAICGLGHNFHVFPFGPEHPARPFTQTFVDEIRKCKFIDETILQVTTQKQVHFFDVARQTSLLTLSLAQGARIYVDAPSRTILSASTEDNREWTLATTQFDETWSKESRSEQTIVPSSEIIAVTLNPLNVDEVALLHGDSSISLWPLALHSGPRVKFNGLRDPAVSPKGDLYAVAKDFRGHISLRNARNEEFQELSLDLPPDAASEDNVTITETMHFDPSGRTFAAYAPGYLRIWNAETWVSRLFPLTAKHRDFTYSRDGETLIFTAGTGSDLIVIHPRDFSFETKHLDLKEIQAIGQDEFLGKENNTGIYYRIDRRGEIVDTYDFIEDVRVNQAGTIAMGVSHKDEIFVWDLTSNQRRTLGTVPNPSSIHMVQLPPEENEIWLVHSDNGIIDIFNLDGQRSQRQTGLSEVRPLLWDKNFNYWVLNDQESRLYSRTGQMLLRLKDNPILQPIRDLRYLPSGEIISNYLNEVDAKLPIESFILPRDVEQALPTFCSWMHDYLQLKADEFADVSAFCRSAR